MGDRWQKYVKDKVGDLKKEKAWDLDAARDQYNRALDRKMEAFELEKAELLRKAEDAKQLALVDARELADQKVRAPLLVAASWSWS